MTAERSSTLKLPGRFRYELLHLFMLSMVVVYLFSFQYIPLQDLPQWIYHGHVFNQLVFHGNDFNGFFSLHPYVPPNASATVLIALFELFASPIIAGKLFLLLCMALIYFGSWSFLVAFTQRKHPVYALVALSGNVTTYFFFGLLNFVFGLGIALLGAAYILRRGSTINPYIIALFFLVCYCSHFASLLIFCVPLVALLLQTRDKKLLLQIVAASIPTALLFLHYYFTKEILTFSSSGILDHEYFPTMVRTYKLFPATVMPFPRIKHVLEPNSMASIANYVFGILLHIGSLVFVIRTLKLREKTLQTFIGMLALVAIIISPPYLGGLFFLGERFVYLYWLVLFGYYFAFVHKPRLRTIVSAGAAIVSLAALATLWYATALFNEMDIPANSTRLAYSDPRGGGNPFVHFHFYEATAKNMGVPVFHTGLLTYVGAENVKPF